MSETRREVFERMLAIGPVLVQLDARMFGVRVPAEHRAQLDLRLRFGRPRGARDLQVTDWGLRETLWPGQSCAVPWSAAYLLVPEVGRPYGFPESLPVELAEAARRRAEELFGPVRGGGLFPDPDAVLNGPTEAGTGHCLRLTADGQACAQPTGHGGDCRPLEEPPAPRPRGGLRLVKGEG